jgi:hypothetical protein
MKTVFIRAIEAPVDEKSAGVRDALRAPSGHRFDAEPSSFGVIPTSPFCYWVPDSIRTLFAVVPSLQEGGQKACDTNPHGNDPRYVRASWEVNRSRVRRTGWVPLCKGGAFSQFYSDVHLVVAWDSLRATYPGFLGTTHRPIEKPASADRFFLPGLTWSRRSQVGLSVRVMPEGCAFGQKGPGIYRDDRRTDTLLALLAIVNSEPFRYLVSAQMAFGAYEVGVLNRTPVPSFTESSVSIMAPLASRLWSVKRRLDTGIENSHAFLLPALLQVGIHGLAKAGGAWTLLAARVQSEIEALGNEIHDHAYRLYKISDQDRKRIEQGFGVSAELESRPDDDDCDEEELVEVDTAPLVASLLSWTLGVALGRFDVRLATGECDAPPEPEPFDPLPVCSPGMLTGDDGLPVEEPPSGYPLTFPTDGILVDDPGHPRDVVRAVRSVFETVFDDANARWHEATELLGTPDLRTWFVRDFFEPHIKRYSKSRRKAPIYWQLATASGSYSVWIYIHRATGDTLFRVLNDFVGPKLDHEKAKLDGLTQEAGGNPSAAQRREIEQQETFVGELQALKTEIARVAPLWRPNLDDGVILNFAPLWRLVPQSRSWQGECKKAWDKLVSGDYDWAHLAMHLWPERLVPKCIDDRSLAIAHGLEGVFWHEDNAGAWRKTRVDDATVQQLIRERTSSTVKAALNDLLSAQAPMASRGRTAATRAPALRPVAPAPVASAPRSAAREPAPDVTVSDATLGAVRGAIGAIADGASKADVLAATGLSDAEWNKAIAVLLDRGQVSRTGQKRGTRYHTGGT